MLRVNPSGRRHSAAPRMPRTRTQRQQFAFGGVAFELLSERFAALGALPLHAMRYCVEGAATLAIADVVGALHGESRAARPPIAALSKHEIRFRVDDDGAIEVYAAALSAQLRRVGRKRYVLTARVGSDPEAMLALLRGVSAAVVHAEGGLVLHAAAAELDGRALVFIGPSGAGKSTAVELTQGSHCIAYDHVAIVPSPQGWLAWGLPGGTAMRAPLAAGVVYPLAAILRVRRAHTGSTMLSEPDAAEALFALRESVECADDSPASERAYLHAACELSSQIAVRSLTTVLGSATNDALRPLIANQSPRKVLA